MDHTGCPELAVIMGMTTGGLFGLHRLLEFFAEQFHTGIRFLSGPQKQGNGTETRKGDKLAQEEK
jgi:hypothetical protein